MTIRFTCDNCGSVLKIKDELAGTAGKCPKCKTRFTVPQPGEDAGSKVSSQSGAEEQTNSEAHGRHSDPTPIPRTDPSDLPRESRSQAPDSSAEAVTPKQAAAIHEQSTSSTAGKASSHKTNSDKTAADKTSSKSAAKAEPSSSDDDDFDPVSFLMDGPKKKPTLDLEDHPAQRSPMAGSSAPKRGGGRGFSLDDEEDDIAEEPVDLPPPTRKWGAKSDTTAAAAAERSIGGSTNVAKDLLARSMEESRVRAAQMPEEKPRFNFDVMGFIREVGIKGVGAVAAVLLSVYGVYYFVNGMMGPKIHLPELGYVSGTVTVKGKPTPGIRVYYTPLNREIATAKNSKQTTRDAVGVTNENGEFTLYYLPEVEGAAVGPSKLWMEAMDPTIVIPPSYGVGSDHRVDVSKGSNPPQKIEL